jgi:hypothetical protein
MSFLTGPMAGALVAGSVWFLDAFQWPINFSLIARSTMDFRVSFKHGERKLRPGTEHLAYEVIVA